VKGILRYEKSDERNVFPCQVVARGQEVNGTYVAAIGEAPGIFVASALSSYTNAYKSSGVVPLGTKHVAFIRNSVRAPDTAGKMTWPKLLELKQSNNVNGAFPNVPPSAVGELQPEVAGLPPT